jgi:predicted phage terminase large subunit-like protein
MREAFSHPATVTRELNNRSLYHFLQSFWSIVSTQDFKPNWHIPYLCKELEAVARRVGNHEPRLYDLLINVPPGMTKTITCSIMFPAWCWTQWYWMRFITASYSSALSLESAESCRDLIRSDQFQMIYPEITVKEDKDTKSNYKIVKRVPGLGGAGRASKILWGGNRFSTSVGGTLMGFHGDINIWDDALNPQEAISDKERDNANRWIDETLPTRKTDKRVSTTIGIMQRLHQDDPCGHLLAKKKTNIRHISLPGEIRNFRHRLFPPELSDKYVDELLDPGRLDWVILKDLEADLGQYGYAGQIGQDPTPPGGGMFKVDHFQLMIKPPEKHEYIRTVRYWDKAGSVGKGCYTVGVRMSLLTRKRFIIEDVKRGQWASEERERIIRATAEADGTSVYVYVEQEPGSGGLESAQGTIRNLAGFACYADKPTGDKEFRADPYSVQVNNDNVFLLVGEWNTKFVEEHKFFPFGTFKDQVDAASGSFNQLVTKKFVRAITKSTR